MNHQIGGGESGETDSRHQAIAVTATKKNATNMGTYIRKKGYVTHQHNDCKGYHQASHQKGQKHTAPQMDARQKGNAEKKNQIVTLLTTLKKEGKIG